MENKKVNYTHPLEKYILKKIAIVKKTHTVKTVLAMLEKESNTYDSLDYLYVNDNKGNLIGVFSMRDLFNNSKNTTIEKFMHTSLITVSPETEIEKIAHLALKHDLKAMPVVESKKLIGIIPSKKVIYIVNKALREDIFHFAGVQKSHLEFENSLEIPLFKIVKDRLSWLTIGLFGAMFIAMYISLFEETLVKYLIIGAFVPAIVYISDAMGTQLQTIVVRDLIVLGKEIDLKRYFFRQITASFFIATAIGVILFLAISLFWKVPFIALVISSAVLISLIVTSITAFFITLAIKRFKFDPALGSGPIATIISDITSVMIYLLVVTLLL